MTLTYEPNMVLSTKEYDVVGKRPIRHDGPDKVTGAAKYGADFYTAGMLFAKILRSPHAHARIKSIDTSKAEALDGVRAVVTARDLPSMTAEGAFEVGELTTDLKYLRDGVLASDKVVYRGHPIAGVAAVNAHVAEEALALIEVDYDVLPAVLTAPDAMKDDAPLILEDLTTNEFGEETDKASNIADHFQHKFGDLEKGFAETDEIIEREFNTATVHQGYIEPHSFTTAWNKDGRLHVWVSTQGPFDIRSGMAEVLDLPVSDVKVTPMEIGGGFGAKFSVFGGPVAALLAKKTGHPVKVVNTRAEEFESATPTSGSYLRVKIGATKEGKITAAQAYLAYEAGAYPGSPVGAGAMCVFAPYDIENQTVDGYDVIVNKPKTGAYRAPGSPNVNFAVETVMDEMAESLGIDPMELRLLNAAKEGVRRSDGVRHPRIGCIEVLEAMRDHPHYSAPLQGPDRGRGVAVGYWMNGGGESSINITVHPDGRINLIEGSADIGGTRASIAMMAAEVLGIPAEAVLPSVVDTDSIGFTSGTGGSSVTYKAGVAVNLAAQDVKSKMIERAAMIWGVSASSVEADRGVFRSKADPELRMTFKELASQLNETGGPITGHASLNATGAAGAFAGAIVDVEVDPETGKATVLRFTMVQDAGKAIHPSYVEGQMQGGTVQGIGWALNEEYFMVEDGRMANPTFLDYRMPTSLDLPMIDTVIVEVANPAHPFGVRGVGEVSIAPPQAAIANAIHNATGLRMRQLPMNPGAIMGALWEQNGD